ncbi:Galanin [Cricetulus griseus]|uniref:Galanin peptides n=1 Tax=Cricetulus griseus TaxID=10029 RepID=G3I5B1_CRIGR|nr:Galanin [Cricetulus griseus]
MNLALCSGYPLALSPQTCSILQPAASRSAASPQSCPDFPQKDRRRRGSSQLPWGINSSDSAAPAADTSRDPRTLSHAAALCHAAKEKRGWTLNSAGYLLGPHAIDNHRSFSDKHGLTGKRELQLEAEEGRPGSVDGPLPESNIVRTIMEFLSFLHLKGLAWKTPAGHLTCIWGTCPALLSGDLKLSHNNLNGETTKRF